MNFNKSINALILLSVATTDASLLRGGQVQDQNPVSRALSGENYSNMKACGHSKDALDGPKYFWMTMMDGDKNFLSSCLLTLDEDHQFNCCTWENSTFYDKDSNLMVVSDPYTITNSSSKAYQACGEKGGLACPGYSFEDNQVSFSYISVQKENGDELRNMGKYIPHGGYDCGLGDKLGTCHSGAEQVYGDFHIGKDKCVEGVITLEQHCDGHYVYSCSPDYEQC